jgi:uncharacterized protein (DUF1697 family)
MPTHIGFLRAVNIGKRQYKTADLRAALEGAGYDDVETHIQTGNIKITCPLRSRAKVEAELEALFLADRGFEVVTMVVSPAELSRIVEEAEQLATKHQPEYGQYLTFLKDKPTADAAAAVEALSGTGETFVVRDRIVHMMYDVPYGTSNAAPLVEKKAGPGTNRNLKVIRTLAEKWGA